MYYKVSKLFIGALTDKLYAFKNRSWELNINNTIDIFDSLGSNIKVYVYGSEVKRVLPLKNDFINEEWISNKTRYFFDGLAKWRVNIPLMKKLNIMIYISWLQAFYFFLLKIWFYSFFHKSQKLIFLNSLFVDYELIITSKILMKKLGFLSFDKKNNLNINDYYLYYLNPNFFEQMSDKNVFFFLGYNLRLESPILNIKLRKRSLKVKDIQFYTIGSIFNDNLNSISLGLNINVLVKYLQGKLKICSIVQKNLKKNLTNISFFTSIYNLSTFNIFLIGNNIINRNDSTQILKFISQLNKSEALSYNLNYNKSIKYLFNFFFNFCKKNLNYYSFFNNINININTNILYMNLTSLLYEEFNLYNNIHNINKINKNDIVYTLGSDFFKFEKPNFLVFQGHHINSSYFNTDLILPSITFLEKSSNFLSIDGSILQTNFVLYPPMFCRNDWSILNALYIYILNFVSKLYKLDYKTLSNYLNTNHFYTQINNINKVIFFLKNLSVNFYFQNITLHKKYMYNSMNNIFCDFNFINKVYNSILNNKYYNPYKLDIVSQYSTTLQACSVYFDNLNRNYQNIENNKKKYI